MFHFQNTPDNWPAAVALLPDHSLIKAVDRADILRDAKQINSTHFTILRHWDDSLQHYDGNTDEDVLVDRAKHYFSTFVDGTFRVQYAATTDAVSWHNEIWAVSQSPAEKIERILATEAAVHVWNTRYRPTFENDIKLVIGEAAVGNNMPRQIAEIAIQSDNILGYHPYSAYGWDNKPRIRWGEDHADEEEHDTLDWTYLSGRWHTLMEQEWDLKPTWAFTEAGPFFSVVDGWRMDQVCGADPVSYVRTVYDWIQDVKLTAAYAEDRILGFTLFTSGGGSKWKRYETRQPEMSMLATMIADEWKPGTKPPPPPPDLDDVIEHLKQSAIQNDQAIKHLEQSDNHTQQALNLLEQIANKT